MADCIETLKAKMLELVSGDERTELEQIFRTYIDVPNSGILDIEQKEKEEDEGYCIDDYMTEETRKLLGL